MAVYNKRTLSQLYKSTTDPTIVVEARQVGNNWKDTAKWCRGIMVTSPTNKLYGGVMKWFYAGIQIPNLNYSIAFPEQWIVKHENGAICIYTDNEFKANFEPSDKVILGD